MPSHPSQHTPGSLWHYVELGTNMSKLETVLFTLVLPYFLYFQSPLQGLLLRHLPFQLVIFVLIVQIPAYFTGKMAYVDIGWPCGLVALGLFVLVEGLSSSIPLNQMFMGLVILLHGGRMFLLGLVFFYPYTFPDGDLSRYQFAKVRWCEFAMMPASHWPFKIQHDTLQQCFFNSVYIACPAMLVVAAADQSNGLHPVEALGFCGWLFFWIMETVADAQKVKFSSVISSEANDRSATANIGNKKPCIGHPPYDDSRFWLWTLCRHPNYFCEWMCWNFIAIASLPSLFRLDLSSVDLPAWIIQTSILLCLLTLSRMFHNCLIWWTGAAPAEYSSARGGRAESYKEYQRSVRCFWPMELSFCGFGPDHYREEGWPVSERDALG